MKRSHLMPTVAMALTVSASAQVTHIPSYPFRGDSFQDRFGWSVSGIGDINGDGFDDFIVGVPQDDNNGSNSGSARVFSGANGRILYTFNGDSAGDWFGISVSGAGDVNNDGVPDFIVGALFDGNTGPASGSARVFSGATGAILYTFNGDAAGDNFGASVSGAGDVNNDGYADVIVGAPMATLNGFASGRARVHSGKTGAILYAINGESTGDNLGNSVSGAGDVNNDGYADFIIGVPFDDNTGENSGSARVYSGATGAVLYIFNGNSAGDNLGNSVSGAGDVNNDGFADVIVGAYRDDFNGYFSGSARVYSGATGAVLHAFNGGDPFDEFGFSVSGAGDVNGDGYDDLIVGALNESSNGSSSGSARVYSGLTGQLLYTYLGETTNDQFGFSVSSVGDVNNDGYADLIVGAPYNSSDGPSSGSARVILSVATSSCPGDANTDGVVNFNDITSILTNWLNVCP